MITITQLVPHAPALLLGLGLLPFPTALAHPLQAEPLSVRECGLALTARAGLTPHGGNGTPGGEEVLADIERHSVVKDPEFLRYLYALTYVESRFRADRKSEANAVGLMQVTLQAAEHIHMLRRLVGLRPGKITLRTLAHTPTNVNIGSAYLWLAYQEARGDWAGALAMYHGGYRALTRLQRGDTVGPLTSQYVLQVSSLTATCGVN